MRLFFFRVLPATVAAILLVVAAHEYATARPSRRTQDVAYVPTTDPTFDPERHRLDVYTPKDHAAAPRPVVLFIHGGSWNSGSKNFYSFIGRRLAKQGIVAVVVNYRLAPKVEVPAMADDCARAVAWTVAHIADYGGNPQRVYLMGHSAGGGLAALLATDDRLLARHGVAQHAIRGVFLDDPAGLDMFDYLQKMQYPGDEQYLVPFGKDPAQWRDVSALYHASAHTPPMRLFIGGQTYPSIRSSAEKFQARLTQLGQQPTLTVLPGKKHAAMVLQLYWQHNVLYKELRKFIGA
ncbi:alpha/beta hydrolase [Hymenobacter mucosus]|uniref:Acetyl esterase/lipase n=1 Tax=Hymenobacter mucosus TaxID=1411120 RepID=A0A238X142_9BACT|nr:alpha/beta hydrolase [Hymenobacter mucosus]SNR52361.1 Acetyl esterase/lipase [Hymenobacter mucosus]